MVKKLRRKFILTATGALLLILIVLIAAINLISLFQQNRSADKLLRVLAAHDGTYPTNDLPDNIPPGQEDFSGDPRTIRHGRRGFDADRPVGIVPGTDDDILLFMRETEQPFHTRYFTVLFDKDSPVKDESAVLECDISHIASVTRKEAVSCAVSVYASLEQSMRLTGNTGTFRYLMQNDQESGNPRLIFLDRSEDIYAARQLFRNSVIIGLFALVAMFLLVFFFSGRVVQPVVESLEKQKRFITDAGHELKTPLSVISADVDVMELEAGKSEWTNSIRSQVKRLNELVGNLLTITRMEEEVVSATFTALDFSKILEKTRGSFLAVAENKGVGYTAETEKELRVKGDADALARLCTLLIDNALQYCAEKGTVHIRLEKDKGNARMEISNPCEKLPEGNPEKLFDRFYRAEPSRSRKKGGFGIGLSAARAIAEAHGGTITAEKDGERTIRFVVLLPLLS